MNSIRRAIAAERKRLLTLSRPSLLRHHSSVASPTSEFLKTPDIKEPEVKPSTVSATVGVQTGSVSWPKKPGAIPWQGKFINSVNLIGQVKVPVQSQAAPDGKYWAGTIISQEDGGDSSDPSTFWISVIFEDDLAHSAVRHLREKDYVHIAGHLSVDGPPVKLNEGQANVQVMAHSVNFVQFSPQPKKFASHQEEFAANDSEILKEDLAANQSLGELNSECNQLGLLPKRSSMNAAFGHKVDGRLLKIDESTPHAYRGGVERLNSDYKVDRKSIDASWRGLLNSPKQWIDNRENKRKGLVKAKYPDFKHKDTGAGLWLESAPVVVLEGLGQLEFYAPPIMAPSKSEKAFEHEDDRLLLKIDESTSEGCLKALEYMDSNHKVDKRSIDDTWWDFLRNPKQWLDYREMKSKGSVKPKYPDFKHKDTHAGLWLNCAPAVVLQAVGQLEFCSPPSKDGDPWKHLLDNPSEWWDNRKNKKKIKSPDFKHKGSGEGLWLSDAPSWALSSLPPLNDADEKKAGVSWAA